MDPELCVQTTALACQRELARCLLTGRQAVPSTPHETMEDDSQFHQPLPGLVMMHGADEADGNVPLQLPHGRELLSEQDRGCVGCQARSATHSDERSYDICLHKNKMPCDAPIGTLPIGPLNGPKKLCHTHRAYVQPACTRRETKHKVERKDEIRMLYSMDSHCRAPAHEHCAPPAACCPR